MHEEESGVSHTGAKITECHAHAVVDYKKYSIADCGGETGACFGDHKQSFFGQLSSSRQLCIGCDNLGGYG